MHCVRGRARVLRRVTVERTPRTPVAPGSRDEETIPCRAPGPEFDLRTIDVISPEHYERNGYPHAEWKYLRRHAPVFRCAGRSNVDDFWAITKHADIIELSKQPEIWENAPQLAVFDNSIPELDDQPARHLLVMDPPDHRAYRNVAARQFTPRTVTLLAPHVEQMTREILDAAALLDEGDFVRDISAPITIGVIADMLGVPQSDRQLLLAGRTR